MNERNKIVPVRIAGIHNSDSRTREKHMSVIELNVKDGVAVITLNRPEAKNAVNQALAETMANILDEIESRDDVRVVVLTGAGGSFCAGMDLKAFVAGEKVVTDDKGFAGFVRANVSKPVIAAVEGYALAGGCELALSCDLIVAASNAKFGLPEVKRGLVAGAGGLLRLPRQLPYRVAMELALTGDMADAQRMYDLGLINRLVNQGEAMAGALELARTIADNAPLSLQVTKTVIAQQQDWSLDEMFDRQAELIGPVMMSEDAIEGSRAFAEKRAPVWKNR
ncbi:crotonase/enoyl-CoA hydratase family protein [Stutzerimonas stutzeri]|uniref:crotonase/enoyl-CoA hydratase family protein n=1 Tax=Stutzerimonas stutzeri TaxID=316 RepID=UPI00210A356E|nr:crotonase/enoyl-CoA hydratase family protein [Stutzerimonas stutzeri]MCQ4323120.1 crotonase/enoyl-CoA hydratase family protein [Stutzerimonas stutzeri]